MSEFPLKSEATYSVLLSTQPPPPAKLNVSDVKGGGA